ncbi:MAG: hypothetical protein ACRDNJ_12210 [Solirubrobacteraceae bacterium]
MSESALPAAPSAGAAADPTEAEVGRAAEPHRVVAWLRGPVLGWLLAAAIVVVSAALVVWARTRPGFDPYGWMVWGHQTLQGTLDTNAAPSWKPLPYIFTVVYALFGAHELRLWMITSAAVSLSGVVFAARIAFKLTGAPPERRWAGWVAGAFAGLALLGIEEYFHYILSSQSDPMIVALCLAAIDCHLDGRVRAALVLGALAGLGRPEAWLFLGLYWLWMWRARPRDRWLLVAVLVAMALLWFGIPALTSRTWFVAGANANDSGRRLTSDQVGGTIGRFFALTQVAVYLAALLAVALAAWRRSPADRVTLALAGGVVAWVIIEIAFALHGWPGLERYMFEAAGVTIALAGVCAGRLLADPPRWGGLADAVAARWIGAGLVAVLVVAMIPPAVSAARAEHRDLREQHVRTAEIADLSAVIGRLGGPARLRQCGEPLTRLEYQTTLAYTLGLNVSRVGFKYGQAIAHHNPIVLYTPRPVGVGWSVQAMRQTTPFCRSLPGA